jgi:hypothetical protein
MLSAWMAAIGISRLNLSKLETVWTKEYWWLVIISLISFTVGFFFFKWLFSKPIPDLIRDPGHKPFLWIPAFAGMVNRVRDFLTIEYISLHKLRTIIYVLFLVSIVALVMFYNTAGNFPLFSDDSDVFRFTADEEVPGLINYTAQFARIFIPLSFFLMFYQGFSFRKHWDLVVLSLLGTVALVLFVSRTQIFFVDLWIMALYFLIRKPNWRQALKFYPVFFLISILVLAVVPIFRQYQSYDTVDYLAGVTEIDSSGYNIMGKALLPIYVGVSFNQQALLHAQQYYSVNPIQHGRVTLDPFTNILGLDQFASQYDLGEIFKSWWNTGTYLFPFVQDFGTSAFFWAPALIAAFLVLVWQFWETTPNFLSINLYAYAIFFTVMTVYLSFTVRAEMYMDLFLLLVIYLIVASREKVSI